MLRHQQNDRPVHVEELLFVRRHHLGEFRLFEHKLRGGKAIAPDFGNAVEHRPVAGQKRKPVRLGMRLDVFDDVTADLRDRHDQRSVHAFPVVVEFAAAHVFLAPQQLGDFYHRYVPFGDIRHLSLRTAC